MGGGICLEAFPAAAKCCQVKSAKDGVLDSIVTALLQSIVLLIVLIVHFAVYGLDIFFFSFSFVKCGLSLSPRK